MTALCLAAAVSVTAKDYTVTSPDGTITAKIMIDNNLSWSLTMDGQQLIAPSEISMTLEDGTVYGAGKCKVKKTAEEDNNGLVLKFKNYDLLFKVFDEGAAYRFVSKSKTAFKVMSEQASFSLPEDWNIYAPYVRENLETLESQYESQFEAHYFHFPVSEWNPERIAFLPALVEAGNGVKLCIMETDLVNYPGMFIYNGDASQTLTGKFAAYPKEVEQGGYKMLRMTVTSREDYIAKYDGATSFPWRIVGVSRNDKELLTNTLTYKLATPPAEDSDFSWVRPGKAAWDWWNDWNIRGVDFRSGINNETYKYYIDFASKNGIEYVILDDNWSVDNVADLMQVIPELNLEELIEYGRERNVGLLLWAGFSAFDKDMDNVCRHYSEMGIKGFKLDFMNRDDQYMVDFHRRAAETAAKYHLIVDFHGTYKPAGLERTYPNILNYEGVYGLEQMKYNKATDQVPYDVTIPFIRMVAGPMDYTQGAMRNATKENYRLVFSEPMSQGTRCRQLAMYVVFNSPFGMLCDTPTAYMREPECLEFMSAVPTVWDEIVPLEGKVAEYVAVAKRSGDTWYVGAMTDWDERELDLDLSFIGEGEWEVTQYADGVNADKAASDYKKTGYALPESKKITAKMASGGGFAAVIKSK